MEDVEFLASLIHVEWGFMEDDQFVIVPKLPLVRAGHRFPPFNVTLPDGRVRQILERIKDGTGVDSGVQFGDEAPGELG